MASERIITIKFTGNSKNLVTEVEITNTALGSLGKKSPELDKLAKSLDGTAKSAEGAGKKSTMLQDLANKLQGLGAAGTSVIKTGASLAVVESAISAVVKAGQYLKPMLGLIGLVPGAVAIAGAAFGVLKLGSAGITAAFTGVGAAAQKQVSDVFQKQLAPAAKNVNTLLNLLTPNLKAVALQMSQVFVAVTKTATSANNVKSLNTVLLATKTAVGNLGGAIAPLVSAFLAVASIAAPMFAQLTAGATGWATKLQAKIQELAADGRLKAWIQGGIDRFIDFKNKIVAFVGEISPVVKNLAGIKLDLFSSLTPAIIPVLTVVSQFLKDHPDLALWIIGIGLAMKILAPAVTAVDTVLTALSANPVILIIAAIVLAIGFLVAGFIYLWNTSDGFRKFWEQVWSGIQIAVSAVVSWFQSTALPFLTTVWNGIVSAAQTAFAWFNQNLLPIFQQVWGGIKDTVNSFLQWADQNIVPWFNQVGGQIAGAVSQISKVWNDLWGGDFGKIVSSAFEIILPILKDAVQVIGDIFGGAFNAIVDVLKGVWDVISGVISGALDIIKGIFKVFAALLTGNWGELWSGLGDILNGAWSIIKGIGEGIGNVLKGIGDVAGGVGRAIGDAFAGLGGILKSALNTLISVANTGIHAINAVTGVVGIPNIPDIPHLARGGNVQAGRPYIVGDGGGPELFVPNQSGRVVGTQATADLMSGGGFGGDLYLTVDLGKGIQQRIQISNRELRAAVKAGSR